MALGKYSRIDGRKSSSYCATATLVVFVALCLVGVWMMTSSAVVPVQTVDLPPPSGNKPLLKQEVPDSKGFEDNPGDLPEDAIKVDANNYPQEDGNLEFKQNPPEKTDENPIQENREEGSFQENRDSNGEPDDASKNQPENEGNEKRDGGKTNPEGGEANGAEQTDGRDNDSELNSGETVNNEEQQSQTEKKSDSETSDDEQQQSQNDKISKENSGEAVGKEKEQGQIEENDSQDQNKESEQSSGENNDQSQTEESQDQNMEQEQSSGENKEQSQTEEKMKEQSPNETSNDEQQQSQNDKNSKENSGEAVEKENEQGQLGENVSQDQNNESEQSSGESMDQSQTEKSQDQNNEPEQSSGENKEQSRTEEKLKEQSPNEVPVFPDGANSQILNETNVQTGAWSTQATESKNEKEVQDSSTSSGHAANKESTGKDVNAYGYRWKLCNDTTGPDYIPCLDNQEAIRKLHSTKHYEHRERHCPREGPTCLVPLPEGYKSPIPWPSSRDKIWYHNVPHTKLAELKGHQNWVKFSGEFLIFPGGGTQFKHGALHYIEFIEEAVADISWGKRTRVVLDVGCGVASFGGYLFDKDVLTMSFAPKDEHEAQVQFALERGIPAISAVMGTQRLPFPSRVFDVVHCARCRVPWHIEGGLLLLELNRVLRPGGYFVWSATPVYQKLEEDVGIWNAMLKLTKAMCWDLVAIKRDHVNQVAAAIYRKPSSNECYEKRQEDNPPLCQESDDSNAAWYVPLQACMHRVPVDPAERGSQWPEQWPQRVEKPPYWLSPSQVGVYGKAAPEDFLADFEHWKHVVSKSYLKGLGISWSSVRNVMDMRSVYGGFAAALRDMNVWVMNVVSIDSPDTLPVIYERGLFGIYHDWCESFSTYPRTYDLLHADHLFSKIRKRCNIVAVIAEVDRILRPGGKLIVRDGNDTITQVENLVTDLQWEVRFTYSKDKEGLLCVQKTMWRPSEVETSMSSLMA